MSSRYLLLGGFWMLSVIMAGTRGAPMASTSPAPLPQPIQDTDREEEVDAAIAAARDPKTLGGKIITCIVVLCLLGGILFPILAIAFKRMKRGSAVRREVQNVVREDERFGDFLELTRTTRTERWVGLGGQRVQRTLQLSVERLPDYASTEELPVYEARESIRRPEAAVYR